MSDSEAMLHEAARRKGQVAETALRLRYAQRFGAKAADLIHLDAQFHRALDDYEEIEERQRKEATL